MGNAIGIKRLGRPCRSFFVAFFHLPGKLINWALNNFSCTKTRRNEEQVHDLPLHTVNMPAPITTSMPDVEELPSQVPRSETSEVSIDGDIHEESHGQGGPSDDGDMAADVVSEGRHSAEASSTHELGMSDLEAVAQIERLRTIKSILRGLCTQRDIKKHEALIRHLQFSRDGRWLAFCSSDRTSDIFHFSPVGVCYIIYVKIIDVTSVA